jgi:nicotinamidase-related amidase
MALDRFFLNRKDSVLLIVDIQERLASKMGERQKVVTNCLHLIEAQKLLNLPVVVTEQYTKGLGPTISEIRESLHAYDPLEKITFSCCKEHAILKRMASTGRGQIIITGMETHICILQTSLDLLKEGYSVHLANDAVCSRTFDNYSTGIELMRDAGVVITCTETILFQLLEKAGSEEFKVISKRIK